MKLLLAIFAVMCVGTAPAQRRTAAPDAVRTPVEQDIMEKILPTDSPYFYPKMMARYMEGDTSLTDDHYFYLYYGYAYEPDFDAHGELPGEGTIAEVFGRGGTLSREDALAILEAGRKNMAVDPFSPSNVNMMTFACRMAGDSVGVKVNADRFAKIVRAITSSGTGLREKSPWHILRFDHANDIVVARGLEIINRQVRSRDVEYIQVALNSTGVKGYFFDFSRIYWKPFDGERVKKNSKWMFNGYPM